MCVVSAAQKRRIAELMSQLPMELDVEKLVQVALGTPTDAVDSGKKARIQEANAAAAGVGSSPPSQTKMASRGTTKS